MNTEAMPLTMGDKAIDTIKLLKTRLEGGPEARSNCRSELDNTLSIVERVTSFFFLGIICIATYYGANALITFSGKPLCRAAGFSLVAAVAYLAYKILLDPHLKKSDEINSAKNVFRDFVNTSHLFWKEDRFQSRFYSTDTDRVLSEFLQTLTAGEGTPQAERGASYLTLLNMRKDEAIKALAVTKIGFNILSLLEHSAKLPPISANIPRVQRSHQEVLEKKKALATANEMEEDLKLTRLEPELKKRVLAITFCLKKDASQLRIGDGSVLPLTKVSDIDVIYNLLEMQAPAENEHT